MLVESRLQRLYTVMQLRHLVAQGAHIRLHSQRGLCPVLEGKGKWPDGGRGLRSRFHDVSWQPPTGSDSWTWYIEDRRPAPAENARGARDAKRHGLGLLRVA